MSDKIHLSNEKLVHEYILFLIKKRGASLSRIKAYFNSVDGCELESLHLEFETLLKTEKILDIINNKFVFKKE